MLLTFGVKLLQTLNLQTRFPGTYRSHFSDAHLVEQNPSNAGHSITDPELALAERMFNMRVNVVGFMFGQLRRHNNHLSIFHV